METIKGYHEERRYMYQHKDLSEKPDKLGVPNALEAHSLGTLLAAGREYFLDYLKENNLSIASIADPKLREEVTNFLTNPLTALSPKYIKEKDYGPDKKQNIVRALHAAGAKTAKKRDSSSKPSTPIAKSRMAITRARLSQPSSPITKAVSGNVCVV